MIKLTRIVAAFVLASYGVSPVWSADPAATPKSPAKVAAPKPAAKPAAAKPAAAKPAAPSGTVKQGGGQGEMDVNITGKNREKLVVGKFDPPAAFNLEDIQNFPED